MIDQTCRYCGEDKYRTLVDGADANEGGALRIKNLLGISVSPERWKALRCPTCGHIQLLRTA